MLAQAWRFFSLSTLTIAGVCIALLYISQASADTRMTTFDCKTSAASDRCAAAENPAKFRVKVPVYWCHRTKFIVPKEPEPTPDPPSSSKTASKSKTPPVPPKPVPDKIDVAIKCQTERVLACGFEWKKFPSADAPVKFAAGKEVPPGQFLFDTKAKKLYVCRKDARNPQWNPTI